MDIPDPKLDSSDDVSRLQANVKNLTQKTDEINEVLKELQDKVSKGNVTNWSVIASMIGGSLTALSMAGYLVLEPLKEEIVRLRQFKMEAIRDLTRMGAEGVAQKERTRALERSEFDEPKDQ